MAGVVRVTGVAMCVRFVAVAVLLLAVGCQVRLTPPTDVVITCSGTADCPDGRVCNPSSGWCVPQGLEDSEPPRLLAPATIAPAHAPIGATVTIQLQVTEALARTPAVSIDTGTATVVLQPTSSTPGQQPSYAYSYHVTGKEAEGTITPTVDLTDRAGNEAVVPLVSTLTFDFTPPDVVANSERLTLVPTDTNRIQNPARATIGTTIEVDSHGDGGAGRRPGALLRQHPHLDAAGELITSTRRGASRSSSALPCRRTACRSCERTSWTLPETPPTSAST